MRHFAKKVADICKYNISLIAAWHGFYSLKRPLVIAVFFLFRVTLLYGTMNVLMMNSKNYPLTSKVADGQAGEEAHRIITAIDSYPSFA